MKTGHEHGLSSGPELRAWNEDHAYGAGKTSRPHMPDMAVFSTNY